MPNEELLPQYVVKSPTEIITSKTIVIPVLYFLGECLYPMHWHFVDKESENNLIVLPFVLAFVG